MTVRLRPGRAIDAPALAALLEERQVETRYHGKARVVPELARKLFAQAAQRHGGTNDGATFLMVAVTDDEAIDAFIMGCLSRIYMVFDRLAASDVFIVGRKACNPRAADALIDAYIAWADGNPKVYEISLSWADTFPGTERITKGFERRGFTLCGQVFRREAQGVVQELAA